MDSYQAQAAYPSPVVTPTAPRFLPSNHFEDTAQAVHLRQHMSSHGHGRQRLSDNAPKRYRKILRDNLPAALNKPTIRRLARRGGVKRIQSEIYETVRDVVKNKVTEILKPAIALAEHRRQKTLTALDVVYALRLIGNPIYGCGTIYRGDEINSRADYMKRRRAGYAQNVRDTQARLDREAENRRIDEHVRRLGGTVNLRGR